MKSWVHHWLLVWPVIKHLTNENAMQFITERGEHVSGKELLLAIT